MNSVVVYCCYCYSQGIVVTGEYIHMYKRSSQVFSKYQFTRKYKIQLSLFRYQKNIVIFLYYAANGNLLADVV